MDDGTISIEVDGYKYSSVGKIDPVLFSQIHETRLRMAERAEEMGYPLQSVPLHIVNWDDMEGMLKYYENIIPKITMEKLEGYLEGTGGQTAYYDSGEKAISIDTKLARNLPETFEMVLFHETLHGQDRAFGNPKHGEIYDPDEIFTTLLTMQYGEENSLPIGIGYPVWVSWVAQAAKEKGMSKQELYAFAMEAHKAGGGEHYPLAVEWIVEGTSVTMYEVDDNDKVTWDKHIETIDEMWPSWRKTWEDVTSMYGTDYEELMGTILMEDE